MGVEVGLVKNRSIIAGVIFWNKTSPIWNGSEAYTRKRGTQTSYSLIASWQRLEIHVTSASLVLPSRAAWIHREISSTRKKTSTRPRRAAVLAIASASDFNSWYALSIKPTDSHRK